MKKVLIVSIMCMLVLCGCREEVRRYPIDARYTPSYQGIETTYENKYDFGTGEFRLMPDTHTTVYPEKYEIQYRIIYNDDTTDTEWRQVAKDEYEEYTMKR